MEVNFLKKHNVVVFTKKGRTEIYRNIKNLNILHCSKEGYEDLSMLILKNSLQKFEIPMNVIRSVEVREIIIKEQTNDTNN